MLPSRRSLSRLASIRLRRRSAGTSFPGSEAYWVDRYAGGGSSGRGSYGIYAEFKAEVLNAFIVEHGVTSVIEFGCGDGNQLSLGVYPRYRGFDVSEHAIAACRALFSDDESKSFAPLADYAGEKADLVLSLDVIYHLVEDEIFDSHMRTLFGAAERFVIIYSSNSDDLRRSYKSHVRHRRFTDWIGDNLPNWNLQERIANPHRGTGFWRGRPESEPAFFVFEKAVIHCADR
jgi:hypothetical protein